MTSDIQITRTKDEPGATTLHVEAPVERVRAAQKKAAQYYAKRARLPGFRKGKVPIDVVKRRFGDAIKESVVRELISESWQQALDKEKLEPIGEPRVQQLVFKDDAPLTFELLVEVKPHVTLDRLGGFTLTRKVVPVTDEVVEGQLQELRLQKAPWVPIDGENPKPGDLVLVTIANLSAGDDEEGKPYQMILGSGQALPEVEEKIMTLTPGDTTETTIRFPDDFADEARRGQTMETRISLQEAKRQQLPELNDDFAREVGDFDSLEELRETTRQDLESAASHEADAGVRRQLLEQIIAANQVPAPKLLVDKLIAAYARAYEVGEAEVEKFAAEFAPIAEGQVKRDLVIEQVARQENLAATEEEIDQRVEEIARSRNTDPGKVYASLQKDNRLRELERSITDDNVFRFLLEQSTITES